MLVDHCVDLLEVDAAGVLLADQRGGVRTAAASSEKAELLELFAADTEGRPCVATIGILQQRTIDHSEILTDQLQTALTTRVAIEEAKGMLAAHSGTLTPEAAFTALRSYARANHERLSDLARKVIDDGAPAGQLRWTCRVTGGRGGGGECGVAVGTFSLS